MTEQETEDNMLMDLIEQDCRVNPKEKIEYPPVCLSMGEIVLKSSKGDTLMPIALGTYGNLSVVTAPPKTKKTFFISLLASVYLSGNNIYGGEIKGHRGNGNLIHFDTEQGLWHCQRVFKRTLDMSGIVDNKDYHPFSLRTIGYKERIQFIDYCLNKKYKDDDWQLTIAGGQTLGQWDQLVKYSQRKSLENNVKFLGPIEKKRLVSIMNESLCLINTSIIESFCMVAVEAMASGCPVVTTAETSMPESVGDAAVIVEANSPEEFASEIYKISTDEMHRKNLIEKGIKHSNKFDNKIVSKQIQEAFLKKKVM